MNTGPDRAALARLRRWGPAAVVLAAAVALCLPMLLHPAGIRSGDAYRDNDWLSILLFPAWLHAAVTELGEFPLWCPFVGGGYPTVLHPSDISLTPLALPVLALGPVWGIKLDLLRLTAVGGLGVLALAREHLGLSRWAAAFSAVAYVAAGWFPSMMMVGFLNLAIYHLIPPLLLCLVRAAERLRHAIPAGLLLGWIAFLAGTGTLTVALFAIVLTLGLAASRLVRDPRGAWRPLAALAAAGGIAVCVAAVKIDGVATLLERGQYSHAAGRGEQSYEGIDWEAWNDHVYPDAATFAHAALTHAPREASYSADGWPSGREYAHLGLPWLAVLLLLPSWWIVGRRLVPWLLAGAVFVALCFGPNSPIDLYRHLIWNLEPLRGISQFYKYGNYFVMLVAVLGSGAILDPLLERLSSPRIRGIAVAAALAGLGISLAFNARPLATLCRLPLPPARPAEAFHQVAAAHNPVPELGEHVYRERARVDGLVELYNLRDGVGTVDWYADIYLPEHTVPALLVDPETGQTTANPDYAGEVTVVEGNGRVVAWRVGANTIDATVALDGPCTVAVNQNHDPAWRSEDGEVFALRGRLALRLAGTGERTVVLRYRPTRFLRGLGISLFALVGCGIGWAVMGRGIRRRGTDGEG